MSEHRCYQCGYILDSIDAPCPKCLPNWNSYSEPSLTETMSLRVETARLRAERDREIGFLKRALAVAYERLLDHDICPECGTHALFRGSDIGCDTCGADLDRYRSLAAPQEER